LTSPVLAALANAKAAEQAAADRQLTAKVREHLKLPAPQGDASRWPTWQAWCDGRKVASLPALPANIAIFIINGGDPGVIESISTIHQDRGVADPILSPVVIAAINQALGPLESPRSWDATHKIRWQQLPRDVATYIGKRQADHDNEIRRLQREYAELRKELKNGTTQQDDATPAAGTTDRTDATGGSESRNDPTA
jgi:hypothetical protein